MARLCFITVSHEIDWDDILHQSVEAALGISKDVRSNTRLGRNDVENGASHPPVAQPLRPPPPPPKPFRLDPGIQGVQRNQENDKMLQELADSPEMLRDRLQKEKERVKRVKTESSRKEAGLKREKRRGWAWLRNS